MKIYKVTSNPLINSKAFCPRYYYCENEKEAIKLFKEYLDIDNINDNLLYAYPIEENKIVSEINYFANSYWYLKSGIEMLLDNNKKNNIGS